jgi:hypothetical protein
VGEASNNFVHFKIFTSNTDHLEVFEHQWGKLLAQEDFS